MIDSENPLIGLNFSLSKCRLSYTGKKTFEKTKNTELAGTQVDFTEDGQIKWKVPTAGDRDSNPIFSFNRYDIELDEGESSYESTFTVGFYNDSDETQQYGTLTRSGSDTIALEFDNFSLVLKAEKDKHGGIYEDPHFHLLSILEEHQFTDFDIIDKKGSKHPAHRVVLQSRLTRTEIDWLNLQSAKVIRLVLHFCYADCLPPKVSYDHLKRCLKSLNDSGSFMSLRQRIHAYLAHHETKMRLDNLLTTIKTLLKEIVQILQARQVRDCHDTSVLVEDVKQIIRLGLTGAIHLVLFNHTFLKNKRKLDKDERKDILLKFVELLPKLAEQLNVGIERVRDIIQDFLALDEQHKEDLVGQGLIYLHQYHTLAHSLFFQALDMAKRRKSAKLANLKHIKLLYVSNLNAITEWGSIMKKRLPYIESKVTKYRTKPLPDQVRRVTRKGSRIAGELSGMSDLCVRFAKNCDGSRNNVRKIKRGMRTLSQHGGWIVSYMSNWIRSDEDFAAMVNRLVKFVDRADFHTCLMELGVLSKHATGNFSEPGFLPGGSLTEPRSGRTSELAAGLSQLLQSKNTDLCDLTVAVTGNDGQARQFLLHRAIAAARCQWLSRALQSGMREAIERRIEIHDVDTEAMELTIAYMYTGCINLSEVPPTTIMDVITIADQFQMQTLSRVCADCLRKCYVNEDTAATLLTFAERLHLAELREASAAFILQHRDHLAPDQVEMLASEEMKRVLEECRGSVRSRRSSSGEGDSPDSDSSPARNAGLLTTPSADELAALAGDEARIQAVMEEIRDKMAIDTSSDSDAWTQSILAADYDVVRAVNFYYDSH